MLASLPRLPNIDQINAELERRKLLTQARERLSRYWGEPAAFARDMISWNPGEGLSPYQEEALNSLFEYKRYTIRGPHGLGKTMMAAIAIHWFSLTRDGLDWKAPTTASVWRQLSKFLWPEIHKWSRRLRWYEIGRSQYREQQELLALSLKLQTGEAFAVASDTPAQIEGAHADHLFYLFDEAKTIPDATFDAAEGAFSGTALEGHEALALATSTPGETHGRFFAIHVRQAGFEDWTTRHVTLPEAVKAGRISQVWADARKRQWGEQSPIYKNRVLGEFAQDESNSLIPLAWVEAANVRWAEWRDQQVVMVTKPITAIGADIARSGSDRTVLALRQKNIIIECRSYVKQSLMETTGRISGPLKRYGGVAVVDVIGVGAGVLDRLRELKLPAVGFNAASGVVKDRWGEKIKDCSGELEFANLRAASWWHLRELLDPDLPYGPIALPPDDELIGELTTPRWMVTSSGKILIESKDDLKKPERLGRSPDYADAVVQAFALELIHDEVGYDVWGGGDDEEQLRKIHQEEVLVAATSGAGFFPGDA